MACSTLLPCTITTFLVLFASLFSRRCLAASFSSFPHAAVNLRSLSVTISTYTAASNAIALQSPAMPNAQASLCTQSIYSFSFPPRPLCTAFSRFPNMICLGNHPPLNWISVPTPKSIFVRKVVSMLSQPVNKTSHNRYSPQGLLVIMLYCIHAVVLL